MKNKRIAQKMVRHISADDGELLRVVREVLDEYFADYDDAEFPKKATAQESENHRSLEWSVDQVLREILGAEDQYLESDCGPAFTSYWQSIRRRALDLRLTFARIQGAAQCVLGRTKRSTYSKRDLEEMLKELPEQIARCTDDKAHLYLAVGFAAAIRAFRLRAIAEINAAGPKIIADFKIERPEGPRACPSGGVLGGIDEL